MSGGGFHGGFGGGRFRGGFGDRGFHGGVAGYYGYYGGYGYCGYGYGTMATETASRISPPMHMQTPGI
jgi:hypothetical protein